MLPFLIIPSSLLPLKITALFCLPPFPSSFLLPSFPPSFFSFLLSFPSFLHFFLIPSFYTLYPIYLSCFLPSLFSLSSSSPFILCFLLSFLKAAQGDENYKSASEEERGCSWRLLALANYYQEPPFAATHFPGTAWEHYRDSGNGRKATHTPFLLPFFLAKHHFWAKCYNHPRRTGCSMDTALS